MKNGVHFIALNSIFKLLFFLAFLTRFSKEKRKLGRLSNLLMHHVTKKIDECVILRTKDPRVTFLQKCHGNKIVLSSKKIVLYRPLNESHLTKSNLNIAFLHLRLFNKANTKYFSKAIILKFMRK